MNVTLNPGVKAEGALAFIKATDDDLKNAQLNPTQLTKDDNVWHLQYFPLGEKINSDVVKNSRLISLSPAAIGTAATQLAAVINALESSDSTTKANNLQARLDLQNAFPSPAIGGKKRHAKTAHKRKQGRSRKIRKSKK
jgi:hypothetical protein